ncbi:multicopper oxidase mco-like [Clavelina lepadiformis]|uniref:multicopper oxidase mco-like n=1 Tax=Clavelina lepadiformis TaxID=159417 RepID=UPI004043795E
MKIIAIASICFVVACVSSNECSHNKPCKFIGGEVFSEPREYDAVNGALNLELQVQMKDFKVEWLTMVRRTYNGEIPAPTWKIRKGDRVNLKLVNNLELTQKVLPFNGFRFPNSTNLHTHGLHISGEEPQDNVFVHVGPGKSYNYYYQIDEDHPAGTYWYHPHLHGSTLFQVHSGMAGMIIVEDDPDPSITPQHLLDVSCPNNCHHEVRLVFQPTMMFVNNGFRGFVHQQEEMEDYDGFRHRQFRLFGESRTLEDWLSDKNAGIEYFTTNGKLWPTYTLESGQIKRFRLVNAGGSASLELTITDTSGAKAKGCQVREIAQDGVYLDKARFQKHKRTLLVPSARADWLVVCNTPGTYKLQSVALSEDNMSMGPVQRWNGTLLKLVVTGTAKKTFIRTKLPERQHFIGDFRQLSQEEVTGRFVIELNPWTRLNREIFKSPTYYRFKAHLGTVQEWYIVNTDHVTSHPIHIHVNHFQVISYNPYTGPYTETSASSPNPMALYAQDGSVCFHQHELYTGTDGIKRSDDPLKYLGHDQRWKAGGKGTLGYSDAGTFHDVLLIPPMSNITIRFMAHKYVGVVVIHCHLLNHEDEGMMMVAQIVPEGIVQ